MGSFFTARVTEVRHWNERLFSFRTEREPGFRFENGQFTMVGLTIDGSVALRAFSIASANYDCELEFFSIKVQDGKLTSRLQHIKVGDEVLVGRKPVGSLVLTDLHAGRSLFLLATGTGLAPFLSIIRDPEAYERYKRVVLVHGVRHVDDLAYHDWIQKELPKLAYLGEQIRRKLFYYPTVTRESFRNRGRITDLLESGKLEEDLCIERIDSAHDRAMICGSVPIIEDLTALLLKRGFTGSPSQGVPGDYVIERAYVD